MSNGGFTAVAPFPFIRGLRRTQTIKNPSLVSPEMGSSQTRPDQFRYAMASEALSLWEAPPPSLGFAVLNHGAASIAKAGAPRQGCCRHSVAESRVPRPFQR